MKKNAFAFLNSVRHLEPQKHFMKYHCLLFCILIIKKSTLVIFAFPYIPTIFFNLKLTLGGAPRSRFGTILKRERRNN